MRTQKLYCYSEPAFVAAMQGNGWHIAEDLPDNVAIISILEPDEANHHFFAEAANVLNVEFDDVDPTDWGAKRGETVYDPGNGYLVYALDDDMAQRITTFIENNKDCDFYIHCAVGASRSQGVVRYILDTYEDVDWQMNPNNPCITPNWHVVCMLKQRGLLDKYRKLFRETN